MSIVSVEGKYAIDVSYCTFPFQPTSEFSDIVLVAGTQPWSSYTPLDISKQYTPELGVLFYWLFRL